jgi:hypothetical protein
MSLDCSRIIASRGTAATGGMIIAGQSGSAAPNAVVAITDRQGNTVTVTAGADGSFRVLEGDLPDGFDHTPGGPLTISSNGTSCTVTIQR